MRVSQKLKSKRHFDSLSRSISGKNEENCEALMNAYKSKHDMNKSYCFEHKLIRFLTPFEMTGVF